VNLVNQFEKPVGLTDWAYTWIKQSILSLALAPGVQLQINNLAAELNISRTPIREALLRLEKDGLVRVVPRKGFFVTEITRRDLEELYEIRELLESRAIEEAVNNLSEGDLQKIDSLIQAGSLSVEEKDIDKFLQTEIDFHAYLVDHSGNRRLISIMEGFRDLTLRWRTLSLRSFENLGFSHQEHKNIVAAVKARDGKKAGQLMSLHIRNSQHRILQLVEHFKESNGEIAGNEIH
jgi:DNA-binding GntR family transcriptional regulator